MKHTLFYFCLLAFCFACNLTTKKVEVQTTLVATTSAALAQPDTVIGTLINIPGTKISIIPPIGFQLNKNAKALIKDSVVCILAYDFPGNNFYQGTATFPKEFQQKGATILHYEQNRINGYEAKFAIMQAEPFVRSCVLLFGDSTFSAMLMGFYSTNDDKQGNEIKASLFSVLYAKNKNTDPLATATFYFQDTTSNFKYSSSATGLFFYTLHGAPSKKNEPALIVTSFAIDKSISLKSIVRQMMEKRDGRILQVKESPSRTINSYTCYECEVISMVENQKMLNYFLAVGQPDKCILINGFCQDKFDTNLAEFKKFAYAVHFK